MNYALMAEEESRAVINVYVRIMDHRKVFTKCDVAHIFSGFSICTLQFQWQFLVTEKHLGSLLILPSAFFELL
jgi:hypothetical protein